MGEERAVACDGDGGKTGGCAFGIEPRGEDGGLAGVFDGGDVQVLGVVRDAAAVPVHDCPAGCGVLVARWREVEQGGEFGRAVVEGDHAASGGDVGAQRGDMRGGEARGVGEEDNDRGRGPRTPVERGIGNGVVFEAGAGKDAFEACGHLGGEAGFAGGGGIGGAHDGDGRGRSKADGEHRDGRGVGVGGATPERNAHEVGLGGGAGIGFRREGAEGEPDGDVSALGGQRRRQPAAAGAEVDRDGAHGLGWHRRAELDDGRRDGARRRGQRNVDGGAVGIAGGREGRNGRDRLRGRLRGKER